ncbi:hypothetical protein FE784_20080 [Paenibacillus hemerocallicola]|uniref:Aminoglycoside phosphotransferase domain-containing protein n=1 Tax=Paenibacillus hemerocallicola TaxID=1172614 RepID=A0A5C4T5S9_9BACL|nr:phosphotransferase [Paenibacillus hemerocallicola]TNJ64423.1 hypothetical protein FE784_20080 [Paenibacillus hemerocallicola]
MSQANKMKIDATLVKRLIAEQFPQWADHPIRPVESAGTDNAIYRLGEDMAVQLPGVEWAIGQVEKEQRWLPKLAPLLPLSHGDLHPGNLLVAQGRLHAVIDFGTLGVGDPACDLMVAWTFLSAESRDIFRAALPVDDATWAQGRGWALSFGLIAYAYYLDTNPVLARISRALSMRPLITRAF